MNLRWSPLRITLMQIPVDTPTRQNGFDSTIEHTQKHACTDPGKNTDNQYRSIWWLNFFYVIEANHQNVQGDSVKEAQSEFDRNNKYPCQEWSMSELSSVLRINDKAIPGRRVKSFACYRHIWVGLIVDVICVFFE